MYTSIALYDSVAAIMNPEELPDFEVLVDFAGNHDIDPEALFAPLVGSDNTSLIFRAFSSLGCFRRDQLYSAGVSIKEYGRIVNALERNPENGCVAQWNAAMEAIFDMKLPCTAWATLADVALECGWLDGRDADFSVHMAKYLTGDAFAAFKSALLRKSGLSVGDVWERVA